MIYDKCPAYNPIVEIQKVEIGSADGEPIYCDKEVLINEYCSACNSNTFDCSECQLYLAEVKNGNIKSKQYE